MDIKILGMGCPKCKALEENARKAVEELGIEAKIEKITDIKEISKYKVMITPALVINGEVKASGKVLSSEEIKNFLK